MKYRTLTEVRKYATRATLIGGSIGKPIYRAFRGKQTELFSLLMIITLVTLDGNWQKIIYLYRSAVHFKQFNPLER